MNNLCGQEDVEWDVGAGLALALSSGWRPSWRPGCHGDGGRDGEALRNGALGTREVAGCSPRHSNLGLDLNLINPLSTVE